MPHPELTRFEGLNNCRLTKIASKRPNSQIAVSHSVKGKVNLVIWEATDEEPEQYAILVIGRGITTGIRTSPIVKIVDFTETSTTFETEGGVYRLEKLVAKGRKNEPL